MEQLLRKVYKEAGIVGPNAIIFEYRKKSIDKVIEEELLEEEEWESLIDWCVGAIHAPEKVLIKLEEIFCEEDSDFSIDGNQFPGVEQKEIRILSEILVYEYCIKNDNIKTLLKILCGYRIGYKMSSYIIYSEVEKYVKQERITQREGGNILELKSLPDWTKLKKELKELDKEDSDYQVTIKDINRLINQVDSCAKNIDILKNNEEVYRGMLEAQREESDILWWMMSEWCGIYETLYHDMKSTEAALTAPVELGEMTKFILNPYAINQVLKKMLSLTKDEGKEVPLTQIIGDAKLELLETMDLEHISIQKCQPVLLALRSKKESLNNAGSDTDWKILFKSKFGKEPDDLQMNSYEFAMQLCLELELANLVSE